jgi:hypothetical protein
MNALFHKKKTLQDALRRCDEVNAKWREKVLSYAKPVLAKLPTNEARLLRSLLGLRAYAGPILASDLAARRAVGRISARVLDAYASASPDARWFHVTLLSDDAHTLERKPRLVLKRLKGKVYKTLQELGLEGVYFIDVDPLPNHPRGGEGGTFLFHAHIVASAGQEFDLQRARQKLCVSRSWRCSLGAKPTTIVEITTKGSPGWWGQYASKPPYRAKSKRVDGEGAVELRWTERGYRPHLALRLVEGFAQIALLDLIGGVGDGKELREEIRKRLAKWHRQRWPDQKRRPPSLVRRLFRTLWLTTRVKGYESWQILGSTV